MIVPTRRRCILSVVALSVMALIWFIPVLWMMSLSLQPDDLLARTTSNTVLGMIPVPFTLDNYHRLFTSGLTLRWFFNSIVVASCMTLMVLTTSALAGFASARIPFRGRALVYAFVLGGLVIPEQAVLIPLHTMFSAWDLHNTYLALVAPRVASPLGVFLMTQFFRGVPAEIEEAASLDGAGRWTIFCKIMLPHAVPALTALGLITFVYAWNDYLWPLVSVQRPEMFTLTLGLAAMQSNYSQSEGLGGLMAAGILVGTPIVVLFLMVHRNFAKGIALGGGK